MAITKVIEATPNNEDKALDDFVEVLSGFTLEEQKDYIEKIERFIKVVKKNLNYK